MFITFIMGFAIFATVKKVNNGEDDEVIDAYEASYKESYKESHEGFRSKSKEDVTEDSGNDGLQGAVGKTVKDKEQLDAEAEEVAKAYKSVEKINNRMSVVVAASNNIVKYLGSEKIIFNSLSKWRINRDSTAFEIKKRLEMLLREVDNIGVVPREIADDVRTIREGGIEGIKDKGINDLEIDGLCSASVTLARRAKRDKSRSEKGQRIIIGLGKSGLPRYKRGEDQHSILNPRMKRIKDFFEKEIKDLGLDNVDFVFEDSNILAQKLMKMADESDTDYSNIIILDSEAAIDAILGNEKFEALRSTKKNKGAFFGSMDMSELNKAEKLKSDEECFIPILEMLSISLELAVGKGIPFESLPSMVTYYDAVKRIVKFLPKMDPMEYQLLKEKYYRKLDLAFSL